MTSQRLVGKVVFITGAAQGIGKASTLVSRPNLCKPTCGKCL